MGGDIAALAAYRGMTVTLQDRSEELIRAGDRSRQGLFRQAAEGARRRRPRRSRACAWTWPAMAWRDADVVIEAIFENIDAKRALYAELEPKLKPSALSGDQYLEHQDRDLAREARRIPARLVGIHFFNPVAQMQLVEIVQGAGTQPQVVQNGAAVHPQARQAAAALQERARLRREPHPDALHQRSAVRSRGRHPRRRDRPRRHAHSACPWVRSNSPTWSDWTFRSTSGGCWPRRCSGACREMLIKRVEQKKFGPQERRRILRLAGRQAVKRLHARPQIAAPADLEDRLILPMLNEAVACLREGIVEDADLLDAGAIFATGFAPFRGGPLQYARERGIANVTARLAELAQRYGERFRPDPGWSRPIPR